MMCFRGRAYCSALCLNTSCDRQFTEQDAADADKWWGKPGAPVQYIDFSPECEEYQPNEGRV